QAEPAADQAAVAEQRLDLLRGGVGGYVEVLGAAADEQVADSAADQVRAEAGVAQAIKHPQRVGADVLARDGVPVARNDAQREGRAVGIGRFLYGHRKRLGRRQSPGGGTGAKRVACGRRGPYTTKPRARPGRPRGPAVQPGSTESCPGPPRSLRLEA